jgi:hypothetical protein
MTNLEHSATIDNSRIETVSKWIATNRKRFFLSDFDLTRDTLTAGNQKNSDNLTFDIPQEFIVNTDSFRFCQDYIMTKSVSSGGFTIKVKLVNDNGTENVFAFDSDDIDQNKFDLQGYLFSYILFHDLLPNDFPHYDFFTKRNLIQTLLHYQKTVECEGFYYRQFVKKNPNIQAKDRRMMTGWNFVEYMKQNRPSLEKKKN